MFSRFKKENHVLYSTDGKGNWRKREWRQQCREHVFIYGQCQVVEGHKGVHWCYGPDGAFHWHANKNERPKHGACGSIPPGHKAYRTPLKMQRFHWRDHYFDSKVTDAKEIKRLEANKMRKGESINMPFDISKLPAKLQRELSTRSNKARKK
jgi:hypothetical protein